MIIKVNGKVIDYDGDISMVINSPAFYDEISYSLQFSVKGTLTNRKIFGFINMPEISDNKTKELPGELLESTLSFTGVIVATWQGGAFNCYFKDNGSFWMAIKDRLISSLPFEKTVFAEPYDYDTLGDIINDYNADDNDHPFAFPFVVNKIVENKFELKVDFAEVINQLILAGGSNQVAVIPFIYLHYIIKNIFEKNGLKINKNAFDKYRFLKRLLTANNYMINEFELDTTELSNTNWIIKEIENSTDPEVVTAEPHTLDNHQFIKLGHLSPEITINNRIFQIELIYNDNGLADEYRFKLLNTDFSAFTAYKRNYVKPSSISKAPDSELLDRIILDFTGRDLPDRDSGYYYFVSDDWTGIILIGNSGNEDLYVGQINWKGGNGVDPIINDPDFATHTYANCSLLSISEYHNDKLSNYAGVIIHDAYYNSILEGTLIKLPSILLNSFKGIDPANHMPSITINQLLSSLKNLGIQTFVNQDGVDIILMKDIITSQQFIDVSAYATILNDIENPNLDGYYLKFSLDGNDDYIKKMLPVQSIDETKYVIKDPVATKIDLSPTASNTNDVRLVIAEKSYYVFNKSFLNVDNNWKFLCYNNLDSSTGNGDLKKEVKISPLLPYFSGFYNEFDVPCSCINFKPDLAMNVRLLSYYKLTVPGSYVPYATSDILNPAGVELPNAGLAIRWEGDKSICDLLLKEYLDWELNVRKDCKSVIVWPIDILSNFDFSKKYRIRSIDYLVKSIKFTLTTNGIKFNETELTKV